MDPSKIEREALDLDLKSRARLAVKLLESLDNVSEKENEQLWTEESERRALEIESGTADTIPLEDVIRDARSTLS